MGRKINILQYIETSGPGGAETVLMNLARNLDRNRFNPSVVIHRSDWLHEQLSKADIPTRVIPCQRSWDIGFLRKFIRACREQQIDIIHSHLFGAGLYACLAGFILRVPVIATFHNEMYLPGSAERFLRLKSLLIRNLAHKIVIVAEFMKEDYLSKGGYPASKMVTVYNGIEFDPPGAANNLDDLRGELGITENDLTVGHVANFRAPKGHRYLIEAAAEVCRREPRAKFLLVGEFGDGSIKSEVDSLIANYGLESRIIMLGFRSDVSRLLKVMDIFVLPSISEGHPLSVVEAMAAAKAVIVTNVGGLPEIVKSGETGFLVEPKDVVTLADKISMLLENPDLRRTVGQRAREFVSAKFSMATMIEQYEKLYEEALS